MTALLLFIGFVTGFAVSNGSIDFPQKENNTYKTVCKTYKKHKEVCTRYYKLVRQ